MIITVALAAAVTLGADVIIDADGCRWLKKTAPAAPHHVARAASAPVKAKPKKHNFLPKPIDGYDPLGCDEGALPGPVTLLFPPTMPPADFTPVPREFEPVLPPEGLYVVPTTFDEGTECGCGSVVFAPPAGGSGGFFVPLVPVAPVPEPSTWALMLAICAAYWRRIVDRVAPAREDW